MWLRFLGWWLQMELSRCKYTFLPVLALPSLLPVFLHKLARWLLQLLVLD
jgi:hypothetical protein